MEQSQMNLSQKWLFYVICGFVLLMVLFSLMASLDKNFSGYEKCVQKKCERKGQEFCQKAREQQNCCAGAGGQLAKNNQGKFTCVFG